MLCFLPGQNVVQEEGGGPQQATGVGAYALLPELFGTCFRDRPPTSPPWTAVPYVELAALEISSTQVLAAVALSRRGPHLARMSPTAVHGMYVYVYVS